jgi:hypothetical protein
LYLGKVSKRDAEAVRLRVEGLLSAAITGSGVIDRDTSVWLSKIDSMELAIERGTGLAAEKGVLAIEKGTALRGGNVKMG